MTPEEELRQQLLGEEPQANPPAGDVSRGLPPVPQDELNPEAQLRQQLLGPEDRQMPPEAETIGGMLGQRLTGADVPPGKSYQVELARRNAIMLGGTAGGLLGAKLPVAPGPLGLIVNPATGAIIGSATGVAAGAVAPEFTLRIAEDLGVAPPGTTEKYGRSMEELQRMVRGEVGLDELFGFASWIPRALGGATASVLTKPSRTARMTSATTGEFTGKQLADQAYTRLGVSLLPFQVGPGKVGRALLVTMGNFGLVGATARGPVYGQSIRQISGQRQVEGQLYDVMRGAPRRVGNTRDFPDLGHAIMGDAQTLWRGYQDHFRQQYEAVWDAADAAGVRVRLNDTAAEAHRIINEAMSQSATRAGNPVLQGAREDMVRFIQERLNLDQTQTMRGADLIKEEAIDGYIRRLEPGQKSNYLMTELNNLRNAVIRDMQTHVIPGPQGQMVGMRTGVPGEFQAVGPQQIADRLRDIDQEYHDVMTSIFETSTAKLFNRVERKGLRGRVWDPTTTTPLGKLADITVQLNDPEGMRELARLTRPETFRDIAASVLERGFSSNMSKQASGQAEHVISFDPAGFAEYFGLGDRTSGRQRAIEEMLKQAHSPLTMDDIRLMHDTMAAIKDSPIGDAAAMASRRAVLGGMGAIVTGFTAGFAARHNLRDGIFGTILALVGVRGVIRAMGNPAGARSLRLGLQSNATLAQTRTSWVRFGRIAFDALAGDLARTQGAEPKDVKQLREQGTQWLRDIDRAFEDPRTIAMHAEQQKTTAPP